MIFGVLADTRTMLSPAELAALRRVFKGVDAILHAGPVGNMGVLEQLEGLAPVKAVCGNAEESYVRGDLYVRHAWSAGPVTMGLVHGYGKPQGLKKWVLKQFEESPVQVLVYGRNFEPTARSLGGHYFFSPGSFLGNQPEGHHGKKGPRVVGLLFLRGKKVDGQPGIPIHP